MEEETMRHRIQYDYRDVKKFAAWKEKWQYSPCVIIFSAGFEFWINSVSIAYVLAINDKVYDSYSHKPAKDEIKGLLQYRKYSVLPKSDIPKNVTIFKSQVDNSMKTDQFRNKTFKIGQIIQDYKDLENVTVIKEAPIILRSSWRIIQSLTQAIGFKISKINNS